MFITLKVTDADSAILFHSSNVWQAISNICPFLTATSTSGTSNGCNTNHIHMPASLLSPHSNRITD